MAQRSTNPTEPDKSRQLSGLSTAQWSAIDLLILGFHDADVAKDVRVTRQTINGWRNQDAEFQAALNARRSEVLDNTRDRLRSTVALATEIVAEALEKERDPKLALTVLKLVASASMQLSQVGPVTVEDVRLAEAEKRDRQRERQLMTNEVDEMLSHEFGDSSGALPRDE